MKTKRQQTETLLDKAEKDFLTVEHELSFSNAVAETVCFHCQQAVEKYLKAYLTFLDIPFSKTHDISELIELCSTKDEQVLKFKEEADKLTHLYEMEISYTDDFYEPSSTDTKEIYDIAESIKKYVLNKIQF
jgi:HEPN domain-containing protein